MKKILQRLGTWFRKEHALQQIKDRIVDLLGLNSSREKNEFSLSMKFEER